MDSSSCLQCQVERGPDLILVRVDSELHHGAERVLGETLLTLLRRHSAHRLVVEFSGDADLPEAAVDQLASVQQQIELRGGMMRICGLSDRNQERLQQLRSDCSPPHYRDRREALAEFRSAPSAH